MGITSAAVGISGLVFSQVNDHLFQSTPNFLIFYGSCFFVVALIGSFILGPIDPVQYENEDHIKFINHSSQSVYSFSTSSTRIEEDDEERPLLSKNVILSADNITMLNHHHKQVSGLAFFGDPIGYSLVVSLMVMSGVGYVYLANLGQMLTSLLHNRVSSSEAQHIRNFHVSLFSLINCGSRVAFGALSDILQRKAGVHRLWFLWSASICLVITLIYLTTSISTADELVPCTVMTAIIYGLVFGLSPTLVTEFGDKVSYC